MRLLSLLPPLLILIVSPVARAQPVSTAALGSTVAVWSGHTTVRERVDAGVNERIELWNRAWIVSPSGHVHENTTHWGFGAADGYAAGTVTLAETGRWTYWASDGGAIDSFVHGDGPWPWYMFPHNPPNGVGYGGAGRRVTAFIEVEAPTTYVLTTSVSGSGSVSGGGSYSAGATATVTATPGGGHAFAGWQGSLAGTANPVSITMDGPKSVTAVFVALNRAPTIAWSAAPGSVPSGQTYTITARAHDADGNLTQVNVWKNGAPFAFSGGGNGTEGDSGNPTSDTGPTTVTFTAQAVDSDGATSATLVHTVAVSAANRAPTIAWTSAPGTVANGQNYSVSARGHDEDGNLAQVNLWKNGVPFAFAGGGNGTDGDSGNVTSDSGPATVTYTAEAIDAHGARSATISQTVVINAPPAVTASIAVSPASADAPGATTVSWSSAHATAVLVSGSGIDSSATSGSQEVSGLPAGTHTYTITAQGAGGPVTRTATFTVNAIAPVSAVISASPTSTTAPGASTISWTSANATAVSVSGPGLSSTSAQGSQAVSGLPTGTYTYTIAAQGPNGPATQSATVTVNAPANSAPTVSWNTTPGTVADGQAYTVSARGHDADGNLTQVNVWKNGVPFAFAGGGNGTEGDSGNTTADAGPATLTFTANAVDALGATSATLTQTVTVAAPLAVSAAIGANPTTASAPGATTLSWSSNHATAVIVSGHGLSSTAANGSQLITGLPVGAYTYTITAQGPGGPVMQTATVTVDAPGNQPPTISWNTTPGAVAHLQAYTVSAHGHDADGNLTQVNVWKNGVPFAFAGGGNGTDGDSGNATSDTGPATVTFTAHAVDALGAVSATISQTVTVAAPPAVLAAIGASPETTTAPGSTTITWSSSNATSVSVAGTGLDSAAASGSQVITGLAAGTHPYTITAHGPGGPVVHTATVTVAAAALVSGTLSTSPGSGTEPAATVVSWTTGNATSVVVSGPGLGSTAESGSQTVVGLTAGTHTYTLTAHGPGGPITRTAIFTVAAAAGVSGSIAASPLVTTAPGSTTITWTTENATAVSVSGPGLASTAANGSENVTGLPVGSHTFTLVAQGAGGPLTRTVAIAVHEAPVVYTVSATAAPVGAGTISGVGSYLAGATATVRALPDGRHDFIGWTGDYSGGANPLSFVVSGHVSLVANFLARNYTLTTAATAGGSVTPGGVYPAGTVVTVSASPDATHRFLTWSGDAGGSVATTAVTLDRAKFVQANFTPRSGQTISFAPPGDHGLGSPPFTLLATATSGLPVNFSLLSGPAILTGSQVQVTGVGPVTLQANQPGDGFFLPAPPVNQVFNVIGAATLKYRGQSRTLLRGETTREAPPYVLENP